MKDTTIRSGGVDYMFSSSTEFKICGNMVPAVGRNLLSARDPPTPAGSLNNIHLTRVMKVYIK